MIRGAKKEKWLKVNKSGTEMKHVWESFVPFFSLLLFLFDWNFSLSLKLFWYKRLQEKKSPNTYYESSDSPSSPSDLFHIAGSAFWGSCQQRHMSGSTPGGLLSFCCLHLKPWDYLPVSLTQARTSLPWATRPRLVQLVRALWPCM